MPRDEGFVLDGSRHDGDGKIGEELAPDALDELAAPRKPPGEDHEIDRLLDRGELHDGARDVPRKKIHDELDLLALPRGRPRFPEVEQRAEVVRPGEIDEPARLVEVAFELVEADLSFVDRSEKHVERDVAAPVRARNPREGVDEIGDASVDVAEDRDASPHVGADRRERALMGPEERRDERVHRAMVQVMRSRAVSEDAPDSGHAGAGFHLVGSDRVCRRDEHGAAPCEILPEPEPDRDRHVGRMDDAGLLEIVDHLRRDLVGPRRHGRHESPAACDAGEIPRLDSPRLHPFDDRLRAVLDAVGVVGGKVYLLGGRELEPAVQGELGRSGAGIDAEHTLAIGLAG
jgi:hypothetical protein